MTPERGWLFSGDLYVSPKPHFARIDDNYHQEIRSLHRILGYDFDVLFCAHRGIVRNGREMLRRKLEYLESLSRKIWELHHQGRSLKEIQVALLGKETSISWLTFTHFSKKNLIRTLLTEMEEIE